MNKQTREAGGIQSPANTQRENSTGIQTPNTNQDQDQDQEPEQDRDRDRDREVEY